MSDTVNLLAFGTDIIGSADTGGSGSGGHTIESPSGTDMTQRSNLQFTDADVTDDSTNDRTEISIVRELTQAEFDELTPEEQNRGVIVIKDANPIYVPSNNAVSVTADGVKTTAQLFAELYALVDVSKITHNTALVRVDGSSGGKTRFSFVTDWNEHEYFSNVMVSNESTKTEELCLYTPASNCYLHRVTGSTYENRSSNVPTSGTTFTLYYNTVCTDREKISPTYETFAVTGGNLTFAISGNVVCVYTKLAELPSGTSVTITTENPHKPNISYALLPIYNTSGSYEPLGSAWLYPNGNIEITKPSSLTSCYISGTYIQGV